MRKDLEIDIVVLVEKATGVSKVVYCSDVVQEGQTMDLYVSELNKSIALFHHEAYADPVLQERREQHNMLYPGSKNNEKIILVGQLCGALHLDPGTYIEISRAALHLKNIPIDEQ